MEAIILAGGVGSRLKAVVPDVPKPMAPINGRPFLEYLLNYWAGQGVSRFVLSVGYKCQIIEEYFSARHKEAEVVYAVEEQPRGTGGGLLLALEGLRGSDSFLVMNGDTFFEVDLALMRRYHQDRRAEVTIALREVEANSRYASVEIDKDGKITAFDNRARTSGRALINGGVYLAERYAFAGMVPESNEPVSIEDQLYPRMLVAGKRMYGFPSFGRFIDIGIPEDYRRAAALLPRA
ncbi:MAG: phosphohexose mutase [Gammaproteobacteria bacterium]|nr:MAG: phosphohexose mutase [Gammaproteobacteria bacterium]